MKDLVNKIQFAGNNMLRLLSIVHMDNFALLALSTATSQFTPKKLMSAGLMSFHILLFPSPGVTL